MTRFERIVMALIVLALVVVPIALRDVFFEDEGPSLEQKTGDLGGGEATSRITRRTGNVPYFPTSAPTTRPAESRPVEAVVLPVAGTIGGVVRDPTGLPISGAKVKSTLYFPPGEMNYGLVAEHIAEALSGDDGAYRLEVPGHGAYRLTATRPGCQPAMRDAVRAGATVDLVLEPGGSLVGIVTGELTKKPVPNAKITLRRDPSNWSETLTTDAKGVFSLDTLFVGKIYVTIEHPSFVPTVDCPIEIAPDGPTSKDFILGNGKRIVGSVCDAQKQPIAGATVTSGPKTTTTDATGEFELAGFGADTQSVSVYADGFLTNWASVNLAGSREEARITVELAKGGALTGDCLDETGKGIVGVEIKVFESYDDSYMYETGDTRFGTKTDQDGRWRVTGVGSRNWGGYRVRARKDGFADAYSKQVQISEEGATVEVRIVMTSGGTISGIVSDETGRPIEGAKVALNPASVGEWSQQGKKSLNEALSDAEGRYSFTRLGEQSYYLSAVAKGFASQYKSDLKIVGRTILDSVNVTLERGEPLKGVVKSEDGLPVKDANVTVQSRTSWANAVTDEHGEYAITNVGVGPFTANASAQGFSNDRKKDVYPDNGRIDFELKKNGYVWGKVIDAATNLPIKGASVELANANDKQGRRSWGRNSVSSTQTDREGKWKIHFQDGSYKIIVNAKGYLTHEQTGISISLTAEPDEITVAMVSGGAVEGWVTDDRGSPLQGVLVMASRQGMEAPEFIQGAQSEADGYFYFGSLKEGMYDFVFTLDQVMPPIYEKDIGVSSGSLPQLRIRSRRRAEIWVSAVGPNDQPLEWLQFSVEDPTGGFLAMNYARWLDGKSVFKPASQKWYWLQGRDGFRIADLPPGAFKIRAYREGMQPFEQELIVSDGGSSQIKLELKPIEKKTAVESPNDDNDR